MVVGSSKELRLFCYSTLIVHIHGLMSGRVISGTWAGIPSPPNDHETNETIVLWYLVAWFLGEVCFAPETRTEISS
jgi:hypothetical protein